MLFILLQITAHRENEGDGGGLHDCRGLAWDSSDFRPHSTAWGGSTMFQSHHLGNCGLDFLGLIKNTLPSVEKPFTIWLHEKCNLDACRGTLKTSACFPWSSAFLPRPASPFLLRKHAFVDLSTTESFPGHPPVSPCFGLTGLTPLLCLAQSVHLQPQRKRITGLTLSTNCF